MLRQASVSQLRAGEITRERGYVAIAMRYHPRGQRLGHEAGFVKSRYGRPRARMNRADRCRPPSYLLPFGLDHEP